MLSGICYGVLRPAARLEPPEHDLLRRVLRRFSTVMGLPRDFLPGMQGFITLSSKACLNQSAS